MKRRCKAVVEGKAASDTRRCVANRDGYPQNAGTQYPKYNMGLTGFDRSDREKTACRGWWTPL